MNWLLTAVRVAFGLFVLGSGTWLFYKGVTTLSSGPLWATLPGLILMILSLLPIDSGLGYIGRGDTTPQVIVMERQAGTPNRLFLLFHGYNGSGQSLVDILGPHLTPYGTVVGFKPNPNGYDNKRVLALAQQAIDTYQPDELGAYGESFGGMVVMDMLRLNPELHLQNIWFNATPSETTKINTGKFFKVLRAKILFHGGPISTRLLHWLKARELHNVPVSEPGVDEPARQRAYRAMLEITGPVLFTQVSYMYHFKPPLPGEFAGRVGTVWYLHAPDNSDQVIDTDGSVAVLRRAFPDVVFRDEQIKGWEGLHAATPERPGSLIEALTAPFTRQ